MQKFQKRCHGNIPCMALLQCPLNSVQCNLFLWIHMSPTYIMYTPYFQFFAIEKDFHVYLLLSLGLFHVTYSFKMHYICISFQGQIKTQSFTSNIFRFSLDTSCIQQKLFRSCYLKLKLCQTHKPSRASFISDVNYEDCFFFHMEQQVDLRPKNGTR